MIAAGVIIGMTITGTNAASPHNGHIDAVAPARLAATACEAEAIAYATAYAAYEASLDVLNDAYDALVDCQSPEGEEGQYELSAERANEIAAMRSVLER
ncbi:MAG TPA: hypothetical protein DDW52_17885 [Planctomycetaceae bacterium]|nr:hypothetical protein [Planctomycetaceae bacterium]